MSRARRSHRWTQRRTWAIALACGLAIAPATAAAQSPDKPPTPTVSDAPVPPVSSEASAAGYSFQVTVEPGAGEVGTPLTLTLSLRAASGRPPQIAFDDIIPSGEPLGDFDVEPIGAPRFDGDALVARYRLTTFASGSLTLPSIVVALPAAAGPDPAPSTPRSLASQPITIPIASFFNEWDEVPTHLRPLKAPVEALDESSRWPLLVGLSAVAGLLLVAVALLLRRLLRPAPAPPAHTIALRACDALAADGLAAAGRVHEFHVRLTDILRGYIEARFGIRAPERTTPEFLAEARASDAFTEGQRTRLAELLTAADRVKFAGARPDSTTCAASLATTRALIEETIPTDASDAKPAAPRPREEARG